MRAPATCSSRSLAIGLSLLVAACGPDDAGPPPNIVLIISDDQGYGDYGFMGSDAVATPHLDRLASRGTVFTHGYSTASICRPALHSILTGLYPIQSDTYRTERALQSPKPVSKEDLIREVATLPRELARHGYASFQAGKYWEGPPVAAGFSEGTGKDDSIGRRTLDPVFDFIDRHVAGPFFLWYAPMLPHIPHHAPAHFREQVDPGLPDRVAAYYANVAWFDDGVGRLVAHLEQADLLEDTLFVFLADNGWDAAAIPSERGGRYRGMLGGAHGKGSLYEQGMRSPFVFVWPGRIPEGQRHAALVSSVDLLPTLLDFAGGKAPEHLPGHSLRAMIEGRAGAVRDALVGSKNAGRQGFFFRDSRWHYLHPTQRSAELYDVERDPGETRNVVADHPDVADRARSRIQSWLGETLERPISPTRANAVRDPARSASDRAGAKSPAAAAR